MIVFLYIIILYGIIILIIVATANTPVRNQSRDIGCDNKHLSSLNTLKIKSGYS